MYGLNANRLALVVAQPKWGGGVQRDHLEYLMGVPRARHKDFEKTLMIAYRMGLIEFCRDYVCPAARAK